jgi:hypothetical protein
MSADEQPSNVVKLSEHRVWPDTVWIVYPGQCTACGYQAMHLAAIPIWASAAPTPDCHKCDAFRSVLPMNDVPEQMNGGTARPWVHPPE